MADITANSLNVIWAIGAAETLAAGHARAGSQMAVNLFSAINGFAYSEDRKILVTATTTLSEATSTSKAESVDGGDVGVSWETMVHIVHGAFMFFAWGICAPVAVVVARYFKVMLGLWWFRVHVIVASLTLILTIAGLVVIKLVTGTISIEVVQGLGGAHSILGVLVIILVVVQSILGVAIDFMFDSERTGIPLRDKSHWWIGRTLVIGSIVNLALGLFYLNTFTYVDVGWFIGGLVWFVIGATFLFVLDRTIGAKPHKSVNELPKSVKVNKDVLSIGTAVEENRFDGLDDGSLKLTANSI
ncbi:hypothetical protein HK096_003591 [Nowakowskiella sp. JEL0078]|nr:hypothetical protein HK096_003591 [Nowakowskiella sp. JEL0078]